MNTIFFKVFKKGVEKYYPLWYSKNVTQLDCITDCNATHKNSIKNSMSFSPFGSGKTTCSTCISCGYKSCVTTI